MKARLILIVTLACSVATPALAAPWSAPTSTSIAPPPEHIYRAIPTLGRLHLDIPDGTQMPVVMEGPLSSKTAYEGQPIAVRLAQDLALNGQVVAPAGSEVLGQVTYSMQARRRIISKVSPHRWLRSSGCIGMEFDTIVTPYGQQIAIDGMPAWHSKVESHYKSAGPLSVNNKGQIRPTVMTAVKQEVKPMLVSGAAEATSFLVSPWIAPAVGAAAGFVKPDLVLTPYETPPRFAHIKGALMGACAGVPGGFLITQTLTRGEEVSLKPQDCFMLKLKPSGMAASAPVSEPQKAAAAPVSGAKPWEPAAESAPAPLDATQN